jgi:hypothetical protein
MSRIALALLGAVLLAGCGAAPAARPQAAPEDPEVAACRAEARDNETVRALRARAVTMSAFARGQAEGELAAAEGRAFNDCLRRRGLSRGGGVERVLPRGALF